MKTVIVYVSTHHGNTKKLVKAIAKEFDVNLIDGTKVELKDLTEYDCIGFASGIAFFKFYPKMLKLIENSLPENKKVFFLFTCGKMSKSYTKTAVKIAKGKGCEILGEYGCLGFDTFGPLKLLGGVAKGHPTEKEIIGALNFYRNIRELC